MSITSQWDDEEKTILFRRFEGRWTWDEFFTTWHEAAAMTVGLDHRIDFIVDMRDSHLLPDQPWHYARRLAALPIDPLTGLTMIVGVSGAGRAFWNVFRALFSEWAGAMNIIFADTPEEARQIIAASRQREEQA
jgi:hypothetical protein